MSEKLSEPKMKTISFVIMHIICHLYIRMKSDKADKTWSTSLGYSENVLPQCTASRYLLVR